MHLRCNCHALDMLSLDFFLIKYFGYEYSMYNLLRQFKFGIELLLFLVNNIMDWCYICSVIVWDGTSVHV
jgi:hypothetical protein